MDNTVLKAALAGLFFPLGDFFQSLNEPKSIAGFIPRSVRQLVPEPFKPERGEAAHQAQEAALLALGVEPGSHARPVFQAEAGLNSILASISLTRPNDPAWKHRLVPLEVETDASYPLSQAEWDSGHWAAALPRLVDRFSQEMTAWQSAAGAGWDQQDPAVFLVTFLAVLRKYFWCVPAPQVGESPGAGTDVSLFEYLRLSSAIAACQARGNAPVKSGEPFAMIVRGDFSGLQGFIYRITNPDSDTEHVSKRLRGRSFYLTALGLVTVDWLLRETGPAAELRPIRRGWAV